MEKRLVRAREKVRAQTALNKLKANAPKTEKPYDKDKAEVLDLDGEPLSPSEFFKEYDNAPKRTPWTVVSPDRESSPEQMTPPGAEEAVEEIRYKYGKVTKTISKERFIDHDL
jgi:hypothetical protein